MGFFHKFMYSTFEQALSMKRALYKFSVIIIIILSWSIISQLSSLLTTLLNIGTSYFNLKEKYVNIGASI